MQRVRGPVDKVYEGLPVVLVDSFDELSAAKLREWAAEHAAKSAAGAYPTVQLADGVRVPERLTSAYWTRVMRAALEADGG